MILIYKCFSKAVSCSVSIYLNRPRLYQQWMDVEIYDDIRKGYRELTHWSGVIIMYLCDVKTFVLHNYCS